MKSEDGKRDNQNLISVKLSAYYYAFAFIMISAIGLITIEKIATNDEYGWLAIFCLVILFMAPPVLLVASKIEATKTDFILSFRTGKIINVSKSNLTSVDQVWNRFVSKGFASYWFGIMYIRNNTEINKFIKAHISKRRK